MVAWVLPAVAGLLEVGWSVGMLCLLGDTPEPPYTDGFTRPVPSLLTGGGIRPGMVFGTTDKHAAYPTNHPVSPGDVVATIYHLLGIDPHLTVPDRAGRPIAIAHGGDPITDILA